MYHNIRDGFSKIYRRLPSPLKFCYDILASTIRLFNSHDTSTLGAGLSYYMIFSIAPLLIIVISVVGSLLGPDAVTGALKEQIQQLMGANTASQLQQMVKAAYQPGKNWIATTLSIILLTTGAMGVFDQLRSSLNIIWDIEQEKKPFLSYVLNRIFSFGMIICIAFLLLISLAVSAGLAGFSAYLKYRFPGFAEIFIVIIEFTLSFSLSTLLFVFVYKFMSDVKIAWKAVFPGAIFTAILFALGKYLIGIYISKSNLANTYGAASSVVVVLLWVFYSSQIVFFGAEFTRALSTRNGMPIKNRKETKSK